MCVNTSETASRLLREPYRVTREGCTRAGFPACPLADNGKSGIDVASSEPLPAYVRKDDTSALE
jgi:hypothetical protein